MFMHKSKKGFTIVELVIVIAVIAILAAVLIPTFSNLVKKANIAADISLTKNLNTILTTDAAIGGKNATAYDAVQAALENGYSVEKLSPTTEKHDILWDSTLDRFVLVNEAGEEVFPQDGKTSANKIDLFKLYEEMPETQDYSIYLKNGFDADSVDVTVGFDAGDNRKINVNYTGTEAQKVIIRTNGGELTVNNPAATVMHYGEAAVVNIDAVASESYHAFGKIQSLIVKSGRAVVEATAKVAVVDASQATAAVKIEAAKADVITSVITGENTNVTVAASAEAAKVSKTEVATLAELQAALDAGEKYIVLTANINASSIIYVKNSVIIDGAGKKITTTGSNTSGDGRAIRVTASDINVTIKNLTIDAANAERAVSVDSNKTGVVLHIDECNFSASHYPVNTAANTSVDLYITDSVISGYCAINLWGGGMNATIMHSTLIGTGAATEGDTNSFTVIKINAGLDKTNLTTHATYDVCVEVSDTTIKAITTNSNKQTSASIDSEAAASRIYFTNCIFENEGANAGGFDFDGATNAIYVDGVVQNPVE